MTEIDPATGRAVWHALIPEFAEGVSVWPGAHRLVVTTLARGARSVFVEVDPTTRRTRVMLGARHGPSTGGLTRLLATPAGFWAEPSGFGGVARIVPRGGHLIARVMYSYEEKSGLAYGGGIVFAGLGGDVLELDPRTGDQLGPPLHPPGGITALAYGGNSAWIGTRDGRLFRYAPGDHALALAARLPWDPTSLTVGGGYVWAASFSTGRIARIGPIPTS